MSRYTVTPELSDERFQVVYQIQDPDVEAQAKAICLEQTVEFPGDLLPEGDIPERIIGRIEDIEETGKGSLVSISYPIEVTGFELTQLLNVIFGNTSIKPGIRVVRLALSPTLLKTFAGPRFGVQGLRDLLGVPKRPLLCTAIKPMGLSPVKLAEQAYAFALGGIDLIKDDHGLANQPFSLYQERVKICADAVAKANAETGRRSLYVPNVTDGYNGLLANARYAKEAGAGALMVSPGLSGFDSVRLLAEDDSLGLPVLLHPALLGSFIINPEAGLSHYVLFGQIARLVGADASIFPHFGGRFAFSEEDCRSIAKGCAEKMGDFASIWPAPGGGMKVERAHELHEFYGNDVLYLIGGDLHRHSPDLVANSRRFLDLIEGLST